MHLKLKNIGQIVDADIRFGDLTVFVGPQASGKTIALEFLKLVVDMGYVQGEMKRYGLDWSGGWGEFFHAYFGEGMGGLWREGKSEAWWHGRKVNIAGWLRRRALSRTSPYSTFPRSASCRFAAAGRSRFRPIRLVTRSSCASSAKSCGCLWMSSGPTGPSSRISGA